MAKTCPQCSQNFAVTDPDRKFYQKVKVPEPTHCPTCRQQRRLLQVNQVNLFKRKCDATGKTIISNYHPDGPYKVFDQELWFSDQVDGSNYGRKFDFNRPFFEQFAELSLAVPHPALFNDFLHDENSEYTNYAGKNKNCYMIFDSDENWDCYYSYGMNNSKNSSDCYRVQNLELCYETVDSRSCYNCAFTYQSKNCTDCVFLNNCIGCRNCIMCSNLRQKEYFVFNQAVPPEKYAEIRQKLGGEKYLTQKIADFNQIRLKFPQNFRRGIQNENVSGNHLVHCKNALFCFDSMNIWDGKYCTQMFMKSKDCMDVDEGGQCELLYESNNLGYNAYNLRFSLQCLNEVNHLTYCNLCFHCSNLFGCIGLKQKKYCILNQPYSKTEYEKLVPKIIEHMQKTRLPACPSGEWGEYFPASTSAFPYNLTMAQDHFPLDKEAAIAQGYAWQDPDPHEYQTQTYQIPDSIAEAPDSILDEILACSECGKNYKILAQELKFYRERNLPIPRKCFHCRHKARLTPRTPRQLWNRKCAHCQAEIQTAYSPERPEIVYCRQCYLESLS